MSTSEERENVVSIAVLAYYLYRLAGCPFGDNLSGLNAWMEVNIQAFEQLAEASEEM